MPADRLSLTALPKGASPAPRDVTKTEQAVLEVLAGLPLDDVAARVGIDTIDLAAAVGLFRKAGRRALHDESSTADWWQLYLEFTNWPEAERLAATHFAPLLNHAQADGSITGWWFIRKHPCWRLRLRLTGPAAKESISRELDQLTADGCLERWWPGIYEAEAAAFGGPTGMAAAHELFCADSQAILNLAQATDIPLQRRELSVLMCTILMRAAGLEWYEQGDAWHLVTLERPLPDDIPLGRIEPMAAAIRQLLHADVHPDGPLLGPTGPLALAASWADAFRGLGREIGTATRDGSLQRGPRAVISYHVIFHWNRLGLDVRTQSILAAAARMAILQASDLP